MMSIQRKLVPIPGTELSPRRGSRVIGRVDPSQRIELTVRLRHRPSGPGGADLEKMVMTLGSQLPGERRYLTHDEYETRYGADDSDISKVKSFAKEQGFEVLAVSSARRTVQLAGPAGKLADAFGITLNLCSHENHVYRERTGTVSVPEELAEIVEGVFGFDTRRMAESQRRAKAARAGERASSGNGSFTPPQVANLYSFPSGLDGTGQCIGILEFGGGFGADDLTTYFNGLGITPPKVVAVSVDGTPNTPGTDPNSDGEVMLDIEVAGAVAPKANIAVYFGDFTVKGWVDVLTQAIHDTTNNPSVISISWGWAENEPLGSSKSSTIWTQAAVNTVNQALMAAGALGITILCAAGDDGSSDGFNDGKDHADFPASSPYLLACGGTKLVGSGTKITSEVVWNETAKNEGATGGGISQLNPEPSYQKGVITLPFTKHSGNFAGRGLPDVAGNADPESGYSILVDGQTQIIGGTSAVAPLWAGLIALLNQGLKAKVGYFNPLLYKTIGPAGDLNDITSGNNGDFKAAKGWDACTGWGSPNGTKLFNALK
jgi:kumamolisin